MDLAEIWRVMRRRWYVLVPGLLLTAVLAVGLQVLLPAKYQSQSTVELLNSQKATAAFDGNPFLSTQVSLTGMADSLARALGSDGSAAELKSRGLTGGYQAKIADNAQGPLLWLTTSGSDRSRVLSADRLLTDYAAERLREFQTQQSVPPAAMIRMTVIVPPQAPVAQTKTRIEYLVLAALAGLVLSLVATFFVEARRRSAAGPPRGRHVVGSRPRREPVPVDADA
ncbi:YveK family protein [Phaeacidiphilus oryzae]|uniref:chain length determinant protein n=1 Tax=Phaeacidiphilus oryzae TaxID=348818 RepID=UPI000B2140EF|nr:chain length determinant protein [Phaeacidiphilus oryzae]